MNTPIKVSIGIPVYNAEKYIERCVISILEQDYASIEVIFVDDASKDRSVLYFYYHFYLFLYFYFYFYFFFLNSLLLMNL